MLHRNIQKVLKGLEVIIIFYFFIFFLKKPHLFLYPVYMLHKSAPSEYKSSN